MIGRGSNLIIPDEGFGGLVLRLKGPFGKKISPRTEDTLVVGAGARLKEICKFACERGLKGFEFLEGIPGTLEGALRMNAERWVGNLRPGRVGILSFADGTIGKFPLRPGRRIPLHEKPTKGSLYGPNCGRKDVRLTGPFET